MHILLVIFIIHYVDYNLFDMLLSLTIGHILIEGAVSLKPT
jgi:hypothetical protein